MLIKKIPPKNKRERGEREIVFTEAGLETRRRENSLCKWSSFE
jgi:hypothetical protein